LISPTLAFDSRLTASLMSWHLIATLVRNGPGVPIVSVMVDKGIVMLVLLRAADGLQILDTPAIPLWRLALQHSAQVFEIISQRNTL
jgi:hypothetical protein